MKRYSFMPLVMLLIIFGTINFSLHKSYADGDEKSPIFKLYNQEIENNYYSNLTDHMEKFKNLEEGTIFIDFKYTGESTNGIYSLFSLSNSDMANGHFHFYISANQVGFENRLEQPDVESQNKHVYTTDINVLDNNSHKLALVVSKESGYHFFLDGELIYTEESDDVKFLHHIFEPNISELGRTKRAGNNNEYTFNGLIHSFEIYDEPLDERTMIAKTKQTEHSSIVNQLINDNNYEQIFKQDISQPFPLHNGEQEEVFINLKQETDKLSSMKEGLIVSHFKSEMKTGINTIFALTDDTKPNYHTHSTLALKNGKLFFSITKDHQSPIVIDQTIPSHSLSDGKWHEIAVLVNNKGTEIYIDGEKEFTDDNDIFLDFLASATDANIGKSKSNQSSGYDFFRDGDISNVSFYGIKENNISDDLQKIKDMTNQTNTNENDSWVFVGSSLTHQVESILAVRDYIGHFEEVVRWEQASQHENRRQRFMINRTNSEHTVKFLNNHYDEEISSYNPKVVSITIGLDEIKGDSKHIESFKDNLQELIHKIRNDQAIPVLQFQNPTTKESLNANLEQYFNMSREVAEELNVIIIDHYTEWLNKEADESGFINKHLYDGKLPNEYGHHFLAKTLIEQLVNTTNGDTYNISDFHDKFKQFFTPTNKEALIKSPKNGEIEINYEVLQSDYPDHTFIAELTFNDHLTLKQTLNGGTHIINSLESSKPIEVRLFAINDETRSYLQFTPMTILAEKGEHASQMTPDINNNEILQTIHHKLQQDDPIKWLFIGDSITHGALWTSGYDSFAQLFEKRIRFEMGRAQDTIINTGVSGATSADLLRKQHVRLDQYDADIVFIMFGMNDVRTIDQNTFKNNIEKIIEQVENKGAIPILMTSNHSYTGTDLDLTLSDYMDTLRSIANHKNLLLVDHDQLWTKATDKTSYIKGANGTWMGDAIHPNNIGHLNMAQNIFSTLKLNNSTSVLAQLEYDEAIEKVQAKDNFSYQIVNDTIEINVAETIKASNYELYALDFKIEIEDGPTYIHSVSAKDEKIILDYLPTNTNLTIHAIGYGKNEQVEVIFDSQDAFIKTKINKENLNELIDTVKQLNPDEYTSDSWDNLLYYLEEAERLVNSDEAKQEDIDLIENQLTKAFNSLEKKTDEDEDQSDESEKEDDNNNNIEDDKNKGNDTSNDESKSEADNSDEEKESDGTNNEDKHLNDNNNLNDDNINSPSMEDSNEDSKEDGHILPKTATPLFNFLLMGFLLIILSTTTLILSSRQKQKNS